MNQPINSSPTNASGHTSPSQARRGGAHAGEEAPVKLSGGHVLVMCLEGEGDALELPGFSLSHSAGARAAARAVEAGQYDCVVAVAPSDIRGLCVDVVQEACEACQIPLVLAASTLSTGLVETLADADVDGFVDLRWHPTLRSAALVASIRRFQLGRNLVEIQRQVLRSVGTEFAGLRDMVFRDELTALHNLRYFREVLHNEHARCKRHGRSYCIVYLDLDNLKRINTDHGHAVGSKALVRLGAVIGAKTRAGDFAFRLGGDEFALVLTEADREGGALYAERLHQAIADASFDQGATRVTVTASIGVAAFPMDGGNPEMVLQRADAAMYVAKDRGGDRWAAAG